MQKVTLILLSLTITLTAGWWRTYGGEERDEGFCIHQTRDGGYIIAGSTDGSSTYRGEFWLIKTDEYGEIQWSKTYGYGPASYVQQTIDGGYIATGADKTLLKLNANGEVLWSRYYYFKAGSRVQQTVDSGYIVVIPGHFDTRLIKTDEKGDTLWVKLYSREGGSIGYHVQQTFDGEYIVVGKMSPYQDYPEPYDIWLLKTDSDGNTLWTKNYQGNGTRTEGYFVKQTSDGGYIIVGASGESDDLGFWESTDIILLKTDKDGNELWKRFYGETCCDVGYCVQETIDGGYIITGHKCIDEHVPALWLLRINSLGDTLWTRMYNGEDELYAVGHYVQQTSDGGYIVAGDIWTSGTKSIDIYLLKTDSLGLLTVEEHVTPPEIQPGFEVVTAVGRQIVLRFAPANRSQGDCVAIFDATGRLVDEIRVPAQGGTITWGEGYGAGVYFIRGMGKSATTQKVILIH